MAAALQPAIGVMRTIAVAAAISAVLSLSAASPLARTTRQPSAGDQKGFKEIRAEAIRRAQVWLPTDVASKDLSRGPDEPGAFEPGAIVRCDYVAKKFPGHTPKFACLIGADDEIKVKYGWSNGEVIAEVAAARLLWALGVPTDSLYSAKVICRGCPETMAGVRKADGDLLVDPVAIERKYPGRDLGSGWSWSELDSVSEEDGGASLAQRDALKLLAAFIQHTDSKSEQQRLVCRDDKADGPCERPVMMIADLGKTFGRASFRNSDVPSSMNLRAWSQTPVWKSQSGCVANLPKSFSGTLKDPAIGEAGRAFLARLLMQLSDTQLHDLFTAARVHLRSRSPNDGPSGFPAAQEWVAAFKAKRAEVAQRTCA
jgi:hypothetical protein